MVKIKTAAAALSAVAAVLLGACGGEVAASGNVAEGPAAGDAIKVQMLDNEFTPKVITARAGEEVTIEITNDGEAVHNLVIEDLEVSSGTLLKGQVATATFTMPGETTEFVCTFHSAMVGELRVG